MTVQSEGGQPLASTLVTTATPGFAPGDHVLPGVAAFQSAPGVFVSVAAVQGLPVRFADDAGTIELGAGTLAALESVTVGSALPAGANNIGIVSVADGAGYAWTDASDTLTTGGAAQTALPVNAGRRILEFTNESGGDLRVNDLGAATATAGRVVAPGRTLVIEGRACPRGAISVWGATTGQRFFVRDGI